ncbi:MAG: aminotransferase class V-fold PLP-dependent enzyme [Planctomycetes bacterium]|nr:aminotransferase class V-fold PLP-dependent enzyme [Planctomycetota bacterium]
MDPTIDDPLLAWRSEFPIVERTNYQISNSLGAMPRRARARLTEYADSWEEQGVRAWGDRWWNLQFEFAAEIEKILGVAPRTVSMHQNVAMASQAILSCFDFAAPRNRIVYSELNFPSVMYLYEQQVRHGAEIVRVPSDDGITIDTQRMVDAIDERTLLVPISHVLFRSGYVQDVRAIVAKARRVGAFVVLDVFQSIGALPLTLADQGVHAVVGGALKYLCGGPGNCFLYVHEDERRSLRPGFTGWAAHKDPFAFSTAGQDFRDDGGRFLNGTPNVPALFAGIEGVRIVAEIGPTAIRQKSLRMTKKMIERCDRHGFTLRSPRPAEQRGNHVSVDVPHGYEVCQALNARDVVCDYRPGAGIRFSPHFYTRDAEAVAAVDAVAEIIESGAHRPWIGQPKKPG